MKRQIALLLGVLAAATGCQKTESATEIILEIATNISVPTEMDTLSLKIGPQANPQAFAQSYPLGAGKVMLPRRMTLVPSSTGTILSVLVEGLLNTQTVVSRSVITKFVQGESRLLRIDLLRECVGRGCPNNQTCTPGGACADPNIDPVNLPVFDPKGPYAPGLNPDASVSMDASPDRPLGDGRTDGVRFDGQPGGERGTSGDGRPPTPEDAPGGRDDARAPDGPGLTKLDTASVVDAPLATSDAPEPLRTRGVACSLPGQCESGLCVDGVCCEGKCDGRCMACNVPGKLGMCTMVPLNDPSNGDCPDDGIATCGRNGLCDGMGGCMLYPSGAACSAGTCPAGTSTYTRAGLCDGQGRCGRGQSQDCSPFLCNASTNTCTSTCTRDEDCVSPNQCINGSCGRKSDGLPCSTSADCKSNVCAQGVCCAEECTGVCKSCAVDGALGTCTNVPAGKLDVQARCLDKGAATCGTNGVCNGAGACQVYPDGTGCPGKCDGAAASFIPFTCGAGTCNPGTAQSCSPYSCDDTGCKKSCTVLSDCAAGFVCGPGGLCVQPRENCMNGVDDDNDGQVDCADPDCQPGFTCVPAVPTGFMGPVALAEGATLADLPACPGDHPTERFGGWSPPECPSTCGDCTCAQPKSVTCGNPRISLAFTPEFNRPSCLQIPAELPRDCLSFEKSIENYNTLAVFNGQASGGSCAPIGGAVNKGPVTWKTAGRVCGSTAGGGAGCPAGHICWPQAPAPYRSQACVFGEGNLACPGTGYAEKHDYFRTQDVNDTRDCVSNCICGDPTDVVCKAAIGIFAKNKDGLVCNADSLKEEGTTPMSCQKLTFNIGSIGHKPASPSGGSCTPSGTTFPTGTCQPTSPQGTVCCIP